MATRKDIATILKTTTEKLDARLIGLGIAPVCSRCGGSGHYSFNQIYSTMCYGCNGSGHVKPSEQHLPAIAIEAQACATDGRLDVYLAAIEARKKLKSGLARVMSAWTATAVAKVNCEIGHMIAEAEVEGLKELRAANKVMADAYEFTFKAFNTATYPAKKCYQNGA